MVAIVVARTPLTLALRDGGEFGARLQDGVMDSDPDAFVAWRLASLGASPGFIGGQAARDRLRGYLARPGAVHHVVRDGRRAIGQLFFVRDPDAWFGGPVVIAWIDRDPSCDRALDPLLSLVDAHAAALDDATLLELRADDAPLLAGLVARGFGVDSVIQLGDPRAALVALGPAEARDPLAERGLALRPLTAERAPEIVALHRAVFSAEPAWCWFGAYPTHLARMARHLAEDPGGHFALVDARQDRVVGHLGAELSETPEWGATGGLELVLTPALRGQGLARSLYRAALRSLVVRGARVIKGGTSQPAVMALGRLMQRPWHTLNLRRGAAFTVDHFLRFAPEHVQRVHDRPSG